MFVSPKPVHADGPLLRHIRPEILRFAEASQRSVWSGKRSRFVIWIDEAQSLSHLSTELRQALLDLFIVLSKQKNLATVVLSTSDYFYLDKLKNEGSDPHCFLAAWLSFVAPNYSSSYSERKSHPPAGCGWPPENGDSEALGGTGRR
jgi:hypothetical protein